MKELINIAHSLYTQTLLQSQYRKRWLLHVTFVRKLVMNTVVYWITWKTFLKHTKKRRYFTMMITYKNHVLRALQLIKRKKRKFFSRANKVIILFL